jgi:energy-coupling factor transporter ATP-binding protein EcfA2
MTLWPSLYSFDAGLRVVLATCLTEKSGLLLHASAVVRDNSAHVFIGPSGSGKTTIARLSGAKTILSDEIVAIRTGPKRSVRVYGTPFWGEMGKGPYCAKSYAARSMFFLKKAGMLRTRRISRGNAVRALLRCVCLFGKEAGAVQTSLDTCSRVVSMVDCKELYFQKKPLEWEKLGI